MKDCIIIIPLYKYDLYDYEIMSLNRILDLYYSKYDIMFLVPDNFDIWKLLNKYYYNLTDNFVYTYYKWHESYFVNSSTYNIICLNKNFYETFINKYNYMLIYQLDAYIFKDELDYWINKEYDYIGSFENVILYNNLLKKDNYLYSINDFNKKYNFTIPDDKKYIFNMNGGCSLRNINFCYNIVNNIDFYYYILYDSGIIAEDSFYSLFCKDVSIYESCKFGYSHFNLELSQIINNYELPFCAHAIHKNTKLFEMVKNHYNSLHKIGDIS